ncbi:MAG: Lrp/AsnC family transcriptional regulator [Bacillota bacterium]|nr:Lrp/AsnC family transcriptional regulator [Bacillota bacterium]
MDNLDIEIINILIDNPKIPYLEIAKTLNVSDSTVHFRIKNLINDKIILGSCLNLDYEKLGYPVTAFIHIKVGVLKYFSQVYEELYNIDGITELHALSGDYNILARLMEKSLKSLNNTIINNISSINHIDDIKYNISLNNSLYKKINL